MRARLAVYCCFLPPVCVALAACHHSEPADNGAVAVVNAGHAPQSFAVPPEPTNAEVITARGTPIATIPASDAGPNPQLTRPAFRDPPLPPELTNDSGLVPLPSPPPPSAFQGEHH